jgi:hypothetical protein
MARDAAALRDRAADQASERLREASEAGIEPNRFWEDFTGAAAKVWKVAVKVATVVAIVVAVIALFVGGPLVWGILLAASLVLLADSLQRYRSGEGALWEVGLNLLGVIPGGRLLTAVGKLAGLGRVGARATAGLSRGLAAARAGLGRTAAGLRAGIGRRLAVMGGETGSASVDLLTGGLTRIREIPAWLQRVRAGATWHVDEQTRLFKADSNNVAELHVARPAGAPERTRSSHNRVDVYNQPRREIVSMKHTQLSEIRPETAQKYIDEAAVKYAPGTRISDVPSNPQALRGEELRGQVILHVPKQTGPIPPAVLKYAEGAGVKIRQAP